MRFIMLVLLFGMVVPTFSATEKDSLNVPFKDRIAIHTNSVGWLLMTPNLGIEYSFIQNDLKKVSALVHGRYNPASLKTYNPNYVYNIGGARAEVRWYYRTRYISQGEASLDTLGCAKFGRFRNFWNKLTTRPYSLLARENPRKHRAYYIGPYLAFDKYTIKLAKTGYQGYSFGFGATMGYSIPLYHYKNGSAIDFELGFSAGLAMSMNDMFNYNADVDCYEYAGSKPLHLVPFPVVTDVRVAFVYRLNSIREQLKGIDQEKIDGFAAVYELRKSYDEKRKLFVEPMVYKDGKKVDNEYYLSSDSIKAWNKVIEQKNVKIREINRIAMLDSRVDSAMLLQELRPYYEYVEVPEKMFNQYNKVIPNKNVTSIRELNDEYLNGLLDKYAEVEADNGEFDRLFLVSYNKLRTKMLDEKKDSTSDIRLIELMVDAFDNVNTSSISQFNKKYNIPSYVSRIEYDRMPSKMVAPVAVEERRTAYLINFVFGVDSIAFAEPQSYSFRGMNAEIEAQNVYKQVVLENMLGYSLTSKGTATKVKTGKKKEKNKDKSKKEKVKKTKQGKKEKSSSADEPVDNVKEENSGDVLSETSVNEELKTEAPQNTADVLEQDLPDGEKEVTD